MHLKGFKVGLVIYYNIEHIIFEVYEKRNAMYVKMHKSWSR